MVADATGPTDVAGTARGGPSEPWAQPLAVRRSGVGAWLTGAGAAALG